jgi:hypothetical protein
LPRDSRRLHSPGSAEVFMPAWRCRGARPSVSGAAGPSACSASQTSKLSKRLWPQHPPAAIRKATVIDRHAAPPSPQEESSRAPRADERFCEEGTRPQAAGPDECKGDQAQLRDAAVLAVGEQADAQKAAVGASSASTKTQQSRWLRSLVATLLHLVRSGSHRPAAYITPGPCLRWSTSITGEASGLSDCAERGRADPHLSRVRSPIAQRTPQSRIWPSASSIPSRGRAGGVPRLDFGVRSGNDNRDDPHHANPEGSRPRRSN